MRVVFHKREADLLREFSGNETARPALSFARVRRRAIDVSDGSQAARLIREKEEAEGWKEDDEIHVPRDAFSEIRRKEERLVVEKSDAGDIKAYVADKKDLNTPLRDVTLATNSSTWPEIDPIWGKAILEVRETEPLGHTFLSAQSLKKVAKLAATKERKRKHRHVSLHLPGHHERPIVVTAEATEECRETALLVMPVRVLHDDLCNDRRLVRVLSCNREEVAAQAP